MWCSTTQSALHLLSVQKLSSPKYIVIHTGTNNLNSQRGHHQIPEAELTCPSAPFSSLTQRCSEAVRLCPNVHLAHHRTIQQHHLYDQVHLNQESIRIFATVFKNTALGRDPPSPRRGQEYPQPPTSTQEHPATETTLQQEWYQRPAQSHRYTAAGVVPATRTATQLHYRSGTIIPDMLIKLN
ncbi:hypothetical protein EOD39_1382 [Acipenser ruthenus]|uniref:Uncharacterized protein n=1 Tax=Acipenser ruthenus TaxID=7906 RepID=A0A444UD23_ACIRT|nr:hypothetical protein EOD39_1382 [Acipenser ruthenus]